MNLSSPSTLLRPPATRNRSQARGFSLLEVAIALVIFVFGALAIVRIFPGALRVINVGGSRQNALGINRATMARVQNNPPYATYDVGQTGSGYQDGYPGDTSVVPNLPPEPRAVLGSTRRGYSLPRTSNLQDYDVSALATVRAVVGEGTTVKVKDGPNPRLFVLTQFPISFNGGNPALQLVEKDHLDGVTIAADGTLDVSNARWSTSGAPFASFTGELFYVTFRYQLVANGPVSGVSDYPCDATQKVDFPGAMVVSGQVDVTCYHDLGSVTATSVTEGDLARGYVEVATGFPTLLPMQGSGTPLALAVGDKVFVDYQADWSRIIQEGNPNIVPEYPSAPAIRQIPLAAPFIEDHAPDAILTDLYTDKGNNTFNITPGAWGEGVAPSGQVQFPTQSDLRASRVTFDMTTSMGTDFNQNARVSYRTRDQWSQQLSVAAAAYKPYVAGQIEPWRDYYLDASNGVMYFHASEAGKSVMVTYSYNDGATVTLRNRLLAIEDQTIQPGGLPTAFNPTPSGFAPNPGYASKLQLTDASGNDLTAGQLLSISSVRGASVTVRTAWLDGNRYTQSFLTAMRAGTGAEAMP